jgi:hypothetical protein
MSLGLRQGRARRPAGAFRPFRVDAGPFWLASSPNRIRGNGAAGSSITGLHTGRFARLIKVGYAIIEMISLFRERRVTRVAAEHCPLSCRGRCSYRRG